MKRCDHDFRWNKRDGNEQSCRCTRCGQVRVVAVSVEQVMYEVSKRPRCVKCGRPDVMWFEGQGCVHEKEAVR